MRLWVSLYMYNSEMFDAIGMLEPSGRGELENVDVNSYTIY
ncbi:MAG: dTDP-glucose pyrophosphorylase [Candidatus Methanomarinus sp.]|nr:MAG: dTDP-glucose pyrophosphorylase [ANME-2 cluster archaeon]